LSDCSMAARALRYKRERVVKAARMQVD
jgi:hypothetical protein